jgi:N-acetylmuramoyl-L-alanine amidase
MPKPRITFVERPSPNFNDRKGQSILFLVIHYTAMDNAEDAIQRLCDPKTEVSSHYVVGKDGTIYRLVDEENRAWHAGVSFWDGHSDLNSSSIGIEIDNTGAEPYNQVQMNAVIALANDIIARRKIRTFYVVGHSDIAPDRKEDPGQFFDWIGSKLGMMATPADVDYKTSASWTDTQVLAKLNLLGYATKNDLKTLVTEFQRHWQQEIFATPDKVGIHDAETRARLASLLRRKAISNGMRKSRLQKSQ